MIVTLSTAAWYGDLPLVLSLPDDWEVTTWWPQTPPPLSDEQIVQALERPVGQAPIRELARRAARPTIIVDDLTRPTPVGRVLPTVLRHLADAGVPPEVTRIVVANGSHSPPSRDAVLKKVGSEAAACRWLVHDYTGDLVRLGRTSFGTPVLVNREVAAADLLIGVGGIYPQHSAGFGGGAKLALGVLGKRSIVALHYRHQSVEGSYEIRNDMRRDLDEVARLVGLRTSISVHVDARRRPVRIVGGDHEQYYQDEVAFALDAYRAPLPASADVVISNAYPIDVSLTFMRSKGIVPLLNVKPGASRVLISACSEGVGHHGLFPFLHRSRLDRPLHLARAAKARPARLPGKAAAYASGRVDAALRSRRESASHEHVDRTPTGGAPNPIWLYLPEPVTEGLPAAVPGMHVLHDWAEVLRRVDAEQRGHGRPKVSIYPCAPLQVLRETSSASSLERRTA